MLSQHLSSALQRLDRRLLEVADHEARRAAILAAADKRGKKLSDDQIELCGVKVNLI